MSLAQAHQMFSKMKLVVGVLFADSKVALAFKKLGDTWSYKDNLIHESPCLME